MPTTSPIVSVCVSASKRDLLEMAARQARTNLSDFVRREALEAAELDILDYRVVTIPAQDWDRFEAWAGAPARDIPTLKELPSTRPAWRD